MVGVIVDEVDEVGAVGVAVPDPQDISWPRIPRAGSAEVGK
jgi:hypothetical protein